MGKLASLATIVLGILWIITLFGGVNQAKLFRNIYTAVYLAVAAIVRFTGVIIAFITAHLLLFSAIAFLALVIFALWWMLFGPRRSRRYSYRRNWRRHRAPERDPFDPLDVYWNDSDFRY